MKVIYRVRCSARPDTQGAFMDTEDRAAIWCARYDRIHKGECRHWVEAAELGPWGVSPASPTVRGGES